LTASSISGDDGWGEAAVRDEEEKMDISAAPNQPENTVKGDNR
jgi:hypothetical protein